MPRELVKTIWLQRLSAPTQSVLVTSSDTFENLAKIADKKKLIKKQSRVHACSTELENTGEMTKTLMQEVVTNKLPKKRVYS